MRYYVLKSLIGSGMGDTEFYDVHPAKTGDAPTCKTCGCYIGMLTALPPYRVELELWDSSFGDIAFGTGDDLLVSARFKELWEARSLAGLCGFDHVTVVKVVRHQGRKPDLSEQPDYFRVLVLRGNAAIDDIRSELERECDEVCPACRLGIGRGGIKRARRIALERGSWSGEDIFIARGLPGTYLLSERFAEFWAGNSLVGAQLIPAEEYSFDFYPSRDVATNDQGNS